MCINDTSVDLCDSFCADFFFFFRLKKFDPDNDDESLSNLETQCDDKDDLQLLHGSSLPTGSVDYMESGMNSCEVLQNSALFIAGV